MRRPPQILEASRFPVTAGTAALAIGVTIAAFLKVDVSALYESAAIRRGELWRLLTSALPHGDPLHLLFNIYWLWVFGSLIEETIGSLRTALLFILLAAVSGAAEYAILSGGIGLSGVGYGLFGFLWVLSRRDGRFRDAIDQNTIALFVAWFFLCIFLTVSGTWAIANIAHGVGAVTGALVGFAVASPPAPRRVIGVAVALLGVVSIGLATVGRPLVNLSNDGSDEARFGYDALMEDHNEAALGWMLDAVRIEPGNGDYWYNLSIAYTRLNQPRHADEALDRARKLKASAFNANR